MFFSFELEFVMRFALKVVSIVLSSLVLSGAVFAQNFPNKTVTLMVPYPAGGVSDVIARTLNNTLAKHLGHMIFQGSPNELILAPLANAAIKYKPEDFRLVQMISINPLAVLARKDFPATNGDELIAYAKKAAAEGKPMTYASVGLGSLYHLMGEHMSSITGIPMTHIPYP